MSDPDPDDKIFTLKTVKNITLIFGCCLSVFFFFDGFGIGMGSNSNDSFWVMTYVYFSLWPTIPLIIVGYRFPRSGGSLLICNAFFSSYLISKIWSDKISFVTKDNIFFAFDREYNFWVTTLYRAFPILLIGFTYLFIELKKRGSMPPQIPQVSKS